MLTVADVKRIMAAQTKLAESVIDNSLFEKGHDLYEEYELFEITEIDSSVSETNGLM